MTHRTAQLDNDVRSILRTGPATTAEIADQLGVSRSRARQALWRVGTPHGEPSRGYRWYLPEAIEGLSELDLLIDGILG